MASVKSSPSGAGSVVAAIAADLTEQVRLHHTLPRERAEEILSSSGIDPSSETVKCMLDGATQPDGSIAVNTGNRENILAKALENKLAVPNWPDFTDKIKHLYETIKSTVHGGANATYIPILAEADPEWFGISVCTVDGQRFDIGDTDVYFSIQSCVKPLSYGLAVEDLGLERVHKHVGIEPSGLAFNEVSLNEDGLPHNPMVNPGAIATGSCIKPGVDMSTRFKYFMEHLTALAGGERVGFSQQTYLCEYETAWRNNALMYYMQEAGVFPVDTAPEDALDFYIQCCAIEVNTVSAAAIAATLANGGTSPLTGAECLSTSTVKSMLTLMFSCGMYDYSGEWCVHVGLPAKSGVAGLVYVVIPHVMGIAIFSPPLDSHGNSVKGVEFCKGLLRHYPYGVFDSVTNTVNTETTATEDVVLEDVEDVVATPGGDLVRYSAAKKHEIARNMTMVRILKTVARLHRSLQFVARNFPGSSAKPPKYHVDVLSVKAFLHSKGISCSHKKNPAVADLLESFQRVPGFVSLATVLGVPVKDNILLKALLAKLVMPNFTAFSRNLTEVYASAAAAPKAAANGLSRVQEEIRRSTGADDDFTVAVCTVDGQQFTYGTSNKPVPLMETMKPLLYSLALKDCGRTAVHEWVASEPTSFPAASFELKKPDSGGHGGPPAAPADHAPEAADSPARKLEDLLPSPDGPHDMPYNPFMTTGTLVLASMLGRGHAKKAVRKFHDTGSRYTHLVDHITAMAGGQRAGFNNPVFLALKQRGLKTLALSHYIKGKGCYPPKTQPTDNAQLYFQACAMELTPEQLAVVAATIANIGVCPTTKQQCLSPATVKSVLSLLYSCGMKTYSGKWAFNVGIPATSGSSGLLMVVIPNIMGIVIHQPNLDTHSVSPLAEAFCRQLTKLYRINLFDQLVFQDKDIAVTEKERVVEETYEALTVKWFDLCMAAADGDVTKVKALIRDGVDVTRCDYDKRTALHIAACDGHLAICQLMVDEGADIDFKDRWDHSPLDDAKANGHADIVAYFVGAKEALAAEAATSLTPARVMHSSSGSVALSALGGSGAPQSSPPSSTARPLSLVSSATLTSQLYSVTPSTKPAAAAAKGFSFK